MHEGWYSGIEEAVATFEEALEYAPDDARILSGLAVCEARSAFVDETNHLTHISRARRLARRAIERAPGWPEPHFAQAMAHYFAMEFGEAIEALHRALEAAGDYADAHELLGRILAEVGDLEQAERHLKRALELNDHLYNARWDLARVNALQGNWAGVDTWLERPVDTEAALVRRYGSRARFDGWRDDPRWIDESRPEEFPRREPFAQICRMAKEVTRERELDEEGRQFLDQLGSDEGGSRFKTLRHQFRTELAAGAEAYDYALAALSDAVDAGLVDINWVEGCPLLDPVRDREEFEELRRRVAGRSSTRDGDLTS